MWQYNQTPNSDELWHAKKNHKYVAKIGEGKDAKYFYSQKEYQAYLKSNKKGGKLTKDGIRIYDKNDIDYTNHFRDKRAFVTNKSLNTTGDRHIVQTMHTNRLFGKTEETELYTPGQSKTGKTIVTTKYYGKADRAAQKASLIAENTIDKGKKTIEKLLKKFNKK